ncbi:hypothetical protein BDZ45DRAFT_751189 [Acephala macrosclerotiorum]|nr:hypothetical protein BDZ45DRAFT_751189 [Acephala macrosclerotiorum]
MHMDTSISLFKEDILIVPRSSPLFPEDPNSFVIFETRFSHRLSSDSFISYSLSGSADRPALTRLSHMSILSVGVRSRQSISLNSYAKSISLMNSPSSKNFKVPVIWTSKIPGPSYFQYVAHSVAMVSDPSSVISANRPPDVIGSFRNLEPGS